MDELSKQLENLQANMQTREEESLEKLNSLKKELKQAAKEKKVLESRLKEQRDLMQSRE